MAPWSKIRKKLEQEYLCPALRGHIQYFATSYSKCPDREGRAAIRLDGEEVLKSSYYEAFAAAWEARRAMEAACPGRSGAAYWESACRQALDAGHFDQTDFYAAFREFDCQSIEQSLGSPNPLVRVFALLDYRLGKRRLTALKAQMNSETQWVRFFYWLRMKAEGLETG